MDRSQIDDNVTLEKALRRANLLAAAAEVSQHISQIMDIDKLLPKMVDIICEAYDFYYAGVFLIDPAGDFAVLRAGRGEPGRIMMENNHKLAVGGNSMIGACTALNEARISLDVDTEKVWYPNPVLPETRSEMALPLAIGGRVIGAVTVQSVEAADFSEEDISSLQAMANQLAIAIDNARQRRQLEEAHAQLVRARTFEAIATATGDAIHWIGNKAEPIGDSVERVRNDIKLLMAAVGDLLISQGVDSSPIARLIKKEATILRKNDPAIAVTLERLNILPLDKLEKHLSTYSLLDDLDIIENAAHLIMQVKEDLIGPAREQAPRPTMVDDVLKDTLTEMDLPPGLVTVDSQMELPLAVADPVQLNRVFVNLLNNAVEATAQQRRPRVNVALQTSPDENSVTVTVTDNGPGIPEEDLDKIWITFHTTKGIKHSGLGLPACRLILEQMGGGISVESSPGAGAAFTVRLPVHTATERPLNLKGKGKLLLIDDADHWRKFAADALAAAGLKVTPARPEKGFDKPGQYDLILIDDILEGTDSAVVLQALQAAGAIGKVLVVSSNLRVERTKERMLLGIKDMLPKPYTRSGLLDSVINALN